MKIHPIKVVYNFIVMVQIFCLIIFLFYLIDSGLDLNIPINIDLVIPMPSLYPDIRFSFNYNFRFNTVTIIIILVAMFVVFIISSIDVVGTGMKDSGTISIKQIVTFIFRYSIMSLPVTFLLSKSDIFAQFIPATTITTLIIYFLNFMLDVGGENTNV